MHGEVRADVAQLEQAVELLLFRSFGILRGHADRLPGIAPLVDRFGAAWVAFSGGLREQLGPDPDEPRLVWGARYMAAEGHALGTALAGIAHGIRAAMDEQAGSARRVNRLSLGLALLVSAVAGLFVHS